jgi:Ribbon-helix-helix protein, copG family
MALLTEHHVAERARKREAYRLRNVSTKLSEHEAARLDSVASRREQTRGELIRELILDELEKDSVPCGVDPVLSEIVGVRLLLVNLLKPQATGQAPFTAIGFESLLEEIKRVKRQVALDIQRESTGEKSK